MQHLEALALPSLGLGKSLALALTIGPLLLTIFPPSRPKPILPPLAEGVERLFIKAGDGNGQLEVLVSYPPSTRTNPLKAPVLFVHGGYGNAGCWYNWIPYFAKEQGRVVYAVSLSGHGLSTRPWFFHLRPKSYFVKDLLAIISYISQQQHRIPPVIISHSAGGGLSQFVIDRHGAQLRAANQISGLICIGPFPPSGGIPVYINWIRIDPTLFLRMTAGDAYTILGTPRRVSRAFFGVAHAHSLYGDKSTRNLPDTVPEGFIAQMNKEESIVWASGMMLPFINTHRVIQNLSFDSPETTEKKELRMSLLAGSHDVLMSPSVMRSIQKAYNCELEFVEGAGHHVMHDIQWEHGAVIVEKKISKWSI